MAYYCLLVKVEMQSRINLNSYFGAYCVVCCLLWLDVDFWVNYVCLHSLQRLQNLSFRETIVITLHLLGPMKDGKLLKKTMLVMITAGKIFSQSSQ